jgi:hypothetical protein
MEPQAKFCGNCGSKTSSLATISRELADIAIGRPASAGSIQVSNIANKQAAQVLKRAPVPLLYLQKRKSASFPQK